MENILSFKQKIDIILEIRQITIKEIERALLKDGTFYKAYAKDREPRKKLLAEFLLKFHIKESWWKNPKGRTERDVFEENSTYVEMPSGSTKDPVEENRILKEVIRRMGDTNDYLLKRIKDLEAGR